MQPTEIIPLLYERCKDLWWLGLIIVVLWLLRTPYVKGYIGECLVRLAARFLLDKKRYHALHNLILPVPDGTTQIDHVFVSVYGIFVLETKNMKGWIFGNEKQAQWTQKIYRKTFTFQNPLRQNYKHVKAIERVLNVPIETIHSVITFVGDSTFKTKMPPNVTYGTDFARYIKSFQEKVFTEKQVNTLLSSLQSAQIKPTIVAHARHVKHLKKRFNDTAEPLCPQCGKPMILRTTKKGSRAGEQFWGCSAFPKCRVIQRRAQNSTWEFTWRFVVCCIVIQFGIWAYFHFVRGTGVFEGLAQISQELREQRERSTSPQTTKVVYRVPSSQYKSNKQQEYVPQQRPVVYRNQQSVENRPQQQRANQQYKREKIYSWKNAQGQMAYSNIGFPEDGELYTEPKVQWK